ncbi:MAG: flippase [Solirubrobacteraceae bacterium]
MTEQDDPREQHGPASGPSIPVGEAGLAAEQPLLPGLARNAGAQLVGRAVGLAAQALGLILVARQLGPDDYGFFALISSLTLMASVVADWGLLLIGTRMAATRPSETERIMAVALGLRLAFSVFAVAILVALALIGSDNPDVHLGALVAGASFVPGAWFSIGHIRAQLDLRMERVAVPAMVGSFAALAWLVGTLELGGGIVALAASFVVSATVSGLVCAAMTPGGLVLRPQLDRQMGERILRQSTPLALSLIGVTIYFYVDALLLARLSTTRELAFYDAAYRFVQVGLFLPGVIVSSVYAVASDLAARDRERMRRFTRELLSIVALVAPLPVVLLAIAPEDLVVLIYGQQYAEAAGPLPILAFAVAVMAFSGVVGPLIVALGFERATLAITAAAVILNVGANVLLIPVLDARGAAVATLLTELVVIVPAAVILIRATGVRPDGLHMAKVAVATAAGSASVWLLPGPIVVRLAAGALVYLGLLVATGAAGRRQLELTRMTPAEPAGAPRG